jgi:hypothetical protein
MHGKYGTTVDRESAYERLTARIAEPRARARAGTAVPPAAPAYEPEPARDEPGFLEKVFDSPVLKSFLRSVATQLGREVTRGIFGTRTRTTRSRR